jgi:hypothetical protein
MRRSVLVCKLEVFNNLAAEDWDGDEGRLELLDEDVRDKFVFTQLGFLSLLAASSLFETAMVPVFASSVLYSLDRHSGLTNEKSRNSSWFIAFTIMGSIGVRIGSSDVKSLSKLLVSLSSLCLELKREFSTKKGIIAAHVKLLTFIQ